jgi:hypothetical protein
VLRLVKPVQDGVGLPGRKAFASEDHDKVPVLRDTVQAGANAPQSHPNLAFALDRHFGLG